jgi:hypothetical protein
VLRDRGQLEEIGGEHWLSALYDFVPTAANAAWYADIIRDRWERRRTIADGKQQIDLASDLSVDNWDADGKYQSPSPARQLIEFLSPSEIVSYEPPPGIVLVGHQHITRGSIFIIGGAPGVGKSRAAVALAEAGATSHDWFGLKIHSKFKTLIIQNEVYVITCSYTIPESARAGWRKALPLGAAGLAGLAPMKAHAAGSEAQWNAALNRDWKALTSQQQQQLKPEEREWIKWKDQLGDDERYWAIQDRDEYLWEDRSRSEPFRRCAGNDTGRHKSR